MTTTEARAPGSYDRVETLAFLAALVEDIATPLSWRAFSDTVRGAPAYTWYGSFDAVVNDLVAKQRLGYGVFVVVNETRPNGHDDASVVAPRAAFVDGDNIPLPETWALPPTLIVCRDDTHWHAYWTTEEGEDIARFRAVQKRLLAYYGTDVQVVNESRVMRVAGFQHFKNPVNPQMYRVLKHAPAAVYTFDQLLAAHPEGAGEAAKPQKAPTIAAEATATSLIIGEGRRNNGLASLAGHLRNLGLSDEAMDGALQIVNRERCQPPLAAPEVRALARSLARYDFDPVIAAVAAGAEPPAPPPVAMLAARYRQDRLANRLNPPPEIVAGCLPVGGIAAFIALPGVGKTLVSLELARCVAAGEPFAGRETRRGKVIYLCPDAPASTERRMLAIPDDVQDNIVSVVDVPKRLPGDIEALRLLVEHENGKAADNPVLLIVVDTWDSARAHGGGGYAEQDGAAEMVMSGLRVLAERYRLAVCIVHHSTKADTGSARGTLVFEARLEWKASVEASGSGVLLTTTKSRDGERGHVGSWRIDTVTVGDKPVPVLIPQSEKQAREMVSESRDLDVLCAIAAMHLRGEAPTVRGVADACGLGRGSPTTRPIARLRSAGWLSPEGLALTAAGLVTAANNNATYDFAPASEKQGGGARVGASDAPGCAGVGAKAVNPCRDNLHPGADPDMTASSAPATPFYKKGGAGADHVSAKHNRMASKPSADEDLFADPAPKPKRKGTM